MQWLAPERGIRFWRWVRQLPLIDPKLVGCSIFLYPTVHDAMAGTGWGGSGFLVGVPSGLGPEWVHLYAVTNDHVRIAAPVIRYRDQEPIGATPDDWIPHHSGDDVAVQPLGLVPDREWPYIEREAILDWGTALSTRLGPGDDCLMVGRYITPDLEQREQPVIRFGNLATWRPEQVWQKERAFNQESFLVDMRSLAGFSGSPVIVYWIKPGVMSLTHPARSDTIMGQRDLMDRKWLLGIDWGHLPATQPVLDRAGEPLADGWQLRVNTGIAAVVPAWKLGELLDQEELVVSRNVAEQKHAAKQ